MPSARAIALAHEGEIRPAVIRLALPAVAEQLLNASVAVVDTYLVGHLGAAELAGVGLANQYVLTATTLFAATAVGCTALIARSIGARNWRLAQVALGQSVLLALLVGGLTLAVGLGFAQQAMQALRAAPEAAAAGAAFLRIVSVTMPLTALLFVGNACLRGAGDTGTPLRVMIVVNVVNIVAAWLLARGFGAVPALGVVGVAIGAALARGVGGGLILLALARGRIEFRLRLADIRLDLPTMSRILRVGAPAGMENLLLRFGQLVFAGLVASLGTTAYAAHVIALNAEALSYMPGAGFAVAATTVVGQNLGARRPDRAMQGANYAFLLGAGAMTFMGLLLIVFPGHFIRLFTSDPAVVATAIPALRIAGTFQPLLAAMMIFSGALRGAGDTRWPLLFNGLGLWLWRVPVGFFVIHVLGGSLAQVWIVLFVDFLLRGGAAYLRFRTGAWQSARV